LTADVAILLLSGAAVVLQAQSGDDPESVFQRIKARSAEHLARLPNYTCHENIERLRRVRGTFQHLDTVELEVAFVGQEELFAPSGGTRFGEQSIEKLVSGGTIGNSALGSHIDFIFSRNGAEFKYGGACKKDGRKALRYDLRVPTERSGFRVRHNGSVGMAGYEGSVWVDPDTFDLVRVDFKVNQIPSYLKVRLIEESLHYKKLTIGNSEFSLPDHSELSATDDMGNYTLNMIKLDRCHEFGAESLVKYGSTVEGSASRDRDDHK
jgi:hypothetical protein